MNCFRYLFIPGHDKDVLVRLRVASLPIRAISVSGSFACSFAETSMRSFLSTIPSLNDSSCLTFQQGKISTGTVRLYNVQQIDHYGGLQTVKIVSCSAASAMACYKLVISFDLREPVCFFNRVFHLASVLVSRP